MPGVTIALPLPAIKRFLPFRTFQQKEINQSDGNKRTLSLTSRVRVTQSSLSVFLYKNKPRTRSYTMKNKLFL